MRHLCIDHVDRTVEINYHKKELFFHHTMMKNYDSLA